VISSRCRGRCGLGCSWFDEDYTWDCHDHDICLDTGGNCSDEFADAANDWAATTTPLLDLPSGHGRLQR